jgi:hypothetical protein
VRKFHHQLCSTHVLDPACGSGNFLYLTLEHLKRLEGEVINQLEALGDTQSLLGLQGETVTPEQLRDIELDERAAALAVQGKLRRFGLITTNSLRQTFNRRVVQTAIDQGLALSFAIPDHPWVDSANGAAVRLGACTGHRRIALAPDSAERAARC